MISITCSKLSRFHFEGPSTVDAVCHSFVKLIKSFATSYFQKETFEEGSPFCVIEERGRSMGIRGILQKLRDLLEMVHCLRLRLLIVRRRTLDGIVGREPQQWLFEAGMLQ